MIDLYTWSTPNGRKISILLEELNVKYKVFPINIMKNDVRDFYDLEGLWGENTLLNSSN